MTLKLSIVPEFTKPLRQGFCPRFLATKQFCQSIRARFLAGGIIHPSRLRCNSFVHFPDFSDGSLGRSVLNCKTALQELQGHAHLRQLASGFARKPLIRLAGMLAGAKS